MAGQILPRCQFVTDLLLMGMEGFLSVHIEGTLSKPSVLSLEGYPGSDPRAGDMLGCVSGPKYVLSVFG